MKRKITFLFLLLAVGLTSAHAASPFKKISGNRLLHVPSRVLFPAKVGLFNRGETRLHDSTGRDVSVRYMLPELIICDVYSYPSGGRLGDLSQEFVRQQEDIRRLNKNVRLISETDTQIIQSGHAIRGKKATYDLVRTFFIGEPKRKCGSQLMVFQDGPWFIAYRFSYPRERSDIAAKHVNDFVDKWRWRER
jgi:hypothetical protein